MAISTIEIKNTDNVVLYSNTQEGNTLKLTIEKATLIGANLTNAYLNSANLTGANLTGASINGVIVTKAQLAARGALNADACIGII